MYPSIIMKLRYQKRDKYGSEIFIASNKYAEETEAYQKLLTIETKLKEKDLNTFLPVYSNKDHGYATIRFKYLNMDSPEKLTERDLYTVRFAVAQVKKSGKEYLNCHLRDISLDHGTCLDLEI